jgi:hypothetical protein
MSVLNNSPPVVESILMKWMTYLIDSKWLKKATLNPNTISMLSHIGRIHEQAIHNPADPATSNAYNIMKQHLMRQYQALKNNGMQFHFTPHDPYESSNAMRNDVSQGHIKVYNVHDLPSDHPLAEMAPGTKQSYNSIFRGVHDVYGHAFTGHQFGAKGELGAYQAHGKMFPKEALPALAAETLSQNAWVNHGPHNPQALSPRERPFAPQKAFAFPQNIAESMLTHES